MPTLKHVDGSHSHIQWEPLLSKMTVGDVLSVDGVGQYVAKIGIRRYWARKRATKIPTYKLVDTVTGVKIERVA